MYENAWQKRIKRMKKVYKIAWKKSKSNKIISKSIVSVRFSVHNDDTLSSKTPFL